MALVDAGHFVACFQLAQKMRSPRKLMLVLALFCAFLPTGIVAAESDAEGHHPYGIGHHPPGAGHHPPAPGVFAGHHPPGVGHHPPGVGRWAPEWSQYRAFIALQAWKKAITDDPTGLTKTWVGPKVCDYEGVFCSPPLGDDDSPILVVAGIDVNGAELKGTLVSELGLLRELGLFHINTNRFTGYIPVEFKYLDLLFEADFSNNKFYGPFPVDLLDLPSLVYLDIRFNYFSGSLPPQLFSKPLDAIFVNNNFFTDKLPENLGESPCSVVVLANNGFDGSIPESIGNMSSTLNEIVALNCKFSGALPDTIGGLTDVDLFDYSENHLTGGIPDSIKDMKSLQLINLGGNKLSGFVSASLCGLPNLMNVTLKDNYFTGFSPVCQDLVARGVILDISGNCVSGSSGQKSGGTCAAFYSPPSGGNPSPSTPDNTPHTHHSSPPSPKHSPSPPPPVYSPPPPTPVYSPPPPVYSPPPPSPIYSPPPKPHYPPYLPPSSPEPQPECPEGYKPGKKSGTCYMLVNEPQTWADAEYYCRQHEDGHLAAAADWDELDDLGHLCQKSHDEVYPDSINPKGLGCYIGGRKPYVISPPNSSWTWPWYPCLPFNQTFWNFGEPNNMGGMEGCLTVKYESEYQANDPQKLAYMFNDLRCDVHLPFVCGLTRCTDVGCGYSDTCKAHGDTTASCYSNAAEGVGYTCNCSQGYYFENSGTCIKWT